jgi:hypothetical protein
VPGSSGGADPEIQARYPSRFDLVAENPASVERQDEPVIAAVSEIRKNHPQFTRYSKYIVPLLGISQQKENLPPVMNGIDEAVKEGVIANEYVAYYVALTHELLISIGVNPEKLRFFLKLWKARYDLIVDLRNTVLPFILGAHYRTSALGRGNRNSAHKTLVHLSRLGDMGIDIAEKNSSSTFK